MENGDSGSDTRGIALREGRKISGRAGFSRKMYFEKIGGGNKNEEGWRSLRSGIDSRFVVASGFFALLCFSYLSLHLLFFFFFFYSFNRFIFMIPFYCILLRSSFPFPSVESLKRSPDAANASASEHSLAVYQRAHTRMRAQLRAEGHPTAAVRKSIQEKL
jgi:hypothetical protein